MSLAAAFALLVAAAALWGVSSSHRLRPPGWRGPFARTGRWAAATIRDSWRRQARATIRRRAAADVVLSLSAELATGVPPETALLRAAEDRNFMRNSIGAVRVGGEVAAGLRADAEQWDLPVLTAVAAVWQVSEGSGAGLSDATHRLGTAALQRERLRRDLASQMAGPKATARVLALLPAVGLLLGSGLGGSPVAWLFGTPLGWLMLALGLGLETVGLWWVTRLVRGVEKHL